MGPALGLRDRDTRDKPIMRIAARIMKSNIKKLVEGLTGFRFWVSRSTDIEHVRNIVMRLRPRATQHPLVRIGPANDGGYLLPDDLDGISACVSPGVSTEIGFDQMMADRDIEVFMADASVAGPPVDNRKFHFFKKFIDVFEGEQQMRLDTLIAIATKHCRHSGRCYR